MTPAQTLRAYAQSREDELAYAKERLDLAVSSVGRLDRQMHDLKIEIADLVAAADVLDAEDKS